MLSPVAKIGKPLVLGDIPAYPPPYEFATREAAYDASVHRRIRGAISGGATGVDAICVSEKYEDDVFTPELIMLTGAGGVRDSEWVADQKLTGGNLGLARAMEDQIPVRVLVKHSVLTRRRSATGYVYVGLYFVTSWKWTEKEDRYQILLFQLEPLPGVAENIRANYDGGSLMPPPRVPVTTNRIVRDPDVTRRIKQLYRNTCQICCIQLQTATGPYSEAAHIRPLGSPHDGADRLDNVLCLCPNCHKRFDLYGLAVDEHLQVHDLSSEVVVGPLNLLKGHDPDRTNLAYQFRSAMNSKR